MSLEMPKTTGQKVLTFVVGLVLLAIVVAILFPVFAPARVPYHGRSITSTLKQLGLANIMYAGDHDDRMPPKEAWMDAIFPYTKNEALYHDPTIKDAGKEPYGIAFFSPLSLLDIETLEAHEDVPLVFQSRLRTRNASSQLSTLPNPPRFEKGNVVGFLDTHTKMMPPDWPTAPIVLRLGR